MNVCNFIGRIGKDAVTRFTQSGKPVTGWSIAIDTGLGDNKTTTWIDCALWGERGEKIAGYIHKGDRIGVSGELGTREHEGKTYVTLNVREVTLLAPKRDDDSAEREPEKPVPKQAAAKDDFEDDIPF